MSVKFALVANINVLKICLVMAKIYCKQLFKKTINPGIPAKELHWRVNPAQLAIYIMIQMPSSQFTKLITHHLKRISHQCERRLYQFSIKFHLHQPVNIKQIINNLKRRFIKENKIQANLCHRSLLQLILHIRMIIKKQTKILMISSHSKKNK